MYHARDYIFLISSYCQHLVEGERFAKVPQRSRIKAGPVNNGSRRVSRVSTKKKEKKKRKKGEKSDVEGINLNAVLPGRGVVRRATWP